MATTFHLFPYLPWELRARVWELTVEPRTVEIGFTGKSVRMRSPTQVPAILHACREARNIGLYKKPFSEVGAQRERGENRYV
ncbi:hypothetical protein QBC45DRAFT_388920 [Copromyces sp. CBS 386.78]|nr:hypothetical protein QBC45DRAFT_388920 [Copromyces sp. CBS 386.78]